MRDSLPAIAQLNGAIVRSHITYLKSASEIAHEFNLDVKYVEGVLSHHRRDEQRVKTTIWEVR